ncbi:MAG: hypothetical protein FE037_04085 [Thermoplasmata archaeon]|nr:MAG: hypothetical protein FE037_04085 [Thermoplasmata archaeon]
MNRAAIILWISVVVAAVVMPLYPLQILETGAGLQYELRTFSSYTELQQYIEESLNNATPPYVYDGRIMIAEIGSSPKTVTGGENTHDFSTTNVQVEGVDEMDIVKTDGEYIYLARRHALHNKSIPLAECNDFIHNGNELHHQGSLSERRPLDSTRHIVHFSSIQTTSLLVPRVRSG